MKKLVLVALSVVAVSCNGIIGNGYKISGEINGLADGTKVFLEKQDEVTGMPVSVDTVTIEKGKFVFEGEAKEPVIHGIRFESIPNAGFALFVEKGNISAKVNKDSIGLAKIAGTYNNDELSKYIKFNTDFEKKFLDFRQKNMPIYQEAEKKKDTVTMNKLNKELVAFQNERVSYNEKYIESNPKSMLSLIFVQGMFGSQTPDLAKIKKFYDNLDSELKETTVGKKIKKQIEESEKGAQGKKKLN